MKVIIDVPDNLPKKILNKKLKEIEDSLRKMADILKIKQEISRKTKVDPWDALDIEAVAVDTSRIDGSFNHDHYIYGTTKK